MRREYNVFVAHRLFLLFICLVFVVPSEPDAVADDAVSPSCVHVGVIVSLAASVESDAVADAPATPNVPDVAA